MLETSNKIRLVKTEDSLTEALEDYLEAIYRIILKKNGVRVKDIAAELKVRNPSVTSVLKSLEKRKLINYEPYGIISLTPAGLKVSLKVTEKHRLFKHFFLNVLGVDMEAADAVACRMEHIIPRSVYVRLIQFIRYIHAADSCGSGIVAGFGEFRASDTTENESQKSLDDYLNDLDADLGGVGDDPGDA